MFLSQGQNFEDAYLWRGLNHIPNGKYLEIDSSHSLSSELISTSFAKQGWSGFVVVEDSSRIGRLRAARPNDEIVDAAISGNDLVPALQPLFTRLERQDVHWMRFSANNQAIKILTMLGETTFRPWIILLSGTTPGLSSEDLSTIDTNLTTQSYTLLHFDGVNRFYIYSACQSHLDFDLATPVLIPDVANLSLQKVLSENTLQLEKLEKRIFSQIDQQNTQAPSDETALQLALDKIATLQQRIADIEAQTEDQLLGSTRVRTAFFHAARVPILEAKVKMVTHGIQQSENHVRHVNLENQNIVARNNSLMAQAEGAQQALKLIKQSTSWRITAPLRWGVQSIGVASKGPKHVVRTLMNELLRFVRRNPAVKKYLLIALTIVPPLKNKLIHFGQVRGGNISINSGIQKSQSMNLKSEKSTLKIWEELLVSTRPMED